jgi:hypothetical protein
MTNRINELFEECGIYLDPHNLEVTRKEVDYLCEQIVIECAALCEEHPSFSGRKLSDLIIKHFGVEL